MRLRDTWRALAKIYSAWSLPLDQVLAGSSYRMLGADFLTSVLDSERAIRVADALKNATPEELSALAQMAEVNIQRTGDVFKAVAICYITLPFAAAAFLSDAAPDQLRLVVQNATQGVFIVIGMLTLAPIAYFIGHWRAKQIGWAIALYRSGALAPKPAA